MQADLVAKTSIIGMISKEEFVQEEDETSMLRILMDHGPRSALREEGPSGIKLSGVSL